MRLDIMTTKALLSALRKGVYTSYGSYPTFFLMDDGETVSHQGIRENLKEVLRAMRQKQNNGYRVVACEINYEDPDMRCAMTNERIPSAYAEPESDDCAASCEQCHG